ncbi:MAG: hypothetical protein JRN20_07570 [Nitrososphaerota archaeon]|nr:hypothetical protein [Nitrososphaerota archaeon]
MIVLFVGVSIIGFVVGRFMNGTKYNSKKGSAAEWKATLVVSHVELLSQDPRRTSTSFQALF